MTVVINGTTGVSGVAGSASTPALIGSDADSGYYINSANEPNASVNGTAVWSAASNFGFKNRLINGGMAIDQRNAGASVPVTTAGPYSLDRWGTTGTQSNKLAVQQNLDSLTPPAGFKNYLGISVTSAYTPINNDYYAVFQAIEGYNIADLGFGASGASTVTLSFWARANNTGSYGASLQNGAENRCYSFTYTINAANTWEYKTITVVGDTTGTWATDNTQGMYVWFGLGAAGSRVGTAGSWGSQAASGLQPSGSFSFVATASAKLYITGVQLEKGSTATSFDFRSYGTELALCQRYFSTSVNAGSAVADGLLNFVSGTLSAYSNNGTYANWIAFPVQMRSTPTIAFYRGSPAGTNGQWQYFTGGWISVTTTSVASSSTSGFAADLGKSASFTANSAYIFLGNYTASSEL